MSCKNMITIDNFSSNNRTRQIGNSLYIICRVEDTSGNWYIHETYNDNGKDFSTANDFHSDSLQFVIDKINTFTKENELTSLLYSNKKTGD